MSTSLDRFRKLNKQYEDLDSMSDEDIEKLGEEEWEVKREQLGTEIERLVDKHPELENEYMEKVAEPYNYERR